MSTPSPVVSEATGQVVASAQSGADLKRNNGEHSFCFEQLFVAVVCCTQCILPCLYCRIQDGLLEIDIDADQEVGNGVSGEGAGA